MNIDPDLREQTLSELLGRFTREATLLIKQELDLAKAELAKNGRVAAAGAAMIGVGGVFGLGAFAALTATFILALALVMPAWLAALIVAIVYWAIAGILALGGKNLVVKAQPLIPETIETIKEDIAWV
ncbi:MAG: phage holin family protein, partial [Candidatus Eremiobacteraeota bacterium]|nr:phage holin family protein [Candidatus Eremiobacteraeota bacterium]